jgi:hypothetical protein
MEAGGEGRCSRENVIGTASPGTATGIEDARSFSRLA